MSEPEQPGQPELPPMPGPPTTPSVAAVVRDGLLVPLEPLNLPDGTPVHAYLTLRLDSVDPPPVVASAPARVGILPAAQRAWPSLTALTNSLALSLGPRGVAAMFTRWDALLLLGSMLVYTLVRFVGLTEWPIFFFCDEAVNTNQALALIQRGFVDDKGVFLPPYFRNVEKYSLSLSVYLHGLSTILFGKSVFVNRATTATVTLLAGIAVAVMLKTAFRQRLWWAGPLVLAAMPVWFLHARTSFETVLMVSFYACFLAAYLLYRYHNPAWVVPTIVCGAATFYSYANGQGVMLISCVLLLLSDAAYHWRTLRAQPRLLLAVVVTTIIVGLQYVRFRMLYPDAMLEHLRVMNSIWLRDVPLSEKLGEFGRNYLQGLSPAFWFMPNNGIDLDRHTFKDWGNLPSIFLPFILVGLWACLREWRSSAHRLILIAILAAPFSASLAFIHNYRVLAMVIPAALLTCLGLERVTGWLGGTGRLARPVAIAVAVFLVGMNLMMLRIALVNGPTWYSDYGLYGMQYGAPQVFAAIEAELDKDPDLTVLLSPDWANNPNEFVPFFLPEPQRGRLRLLSSTEYLARKIDMPPDALYVVSAEEYQNLQGSSKLVLEPPVQILPYPNNQPGFYFLHLRYADNAEALFAAEREERRRLVDGSVTIDGQPVAVRYSLTDLGSLEELFDNDPQTVLRGVEANPFIIEFTFPEPRSLSGFEFNGWQPNIEIKALVTTPQGGEPQTFVQRYQNLPNDPRITFSFGAPLQTRVVRLEITDTSAQDGTKIHIRGLQFRP